MRLAASVAVSLAAAVCVAAAVAVLAAAVAAALGVFVCVAVGGIVGSRVGVTVGVGVTVAYGSQSRSYGLQCVCRGVYRLPAGRDRDRKEGGQYEDTNEEPVADPVRHGVPSDIAYVRPDSCRDADSVAQAQLRGLGFILNNVEAPAPRFVQDRPLCIGDHLADVVLQMFRFHPDSHHQDFHRVIPQNLVTVFRGSLVVSYGTRPGRLYGDGFSSSPVTWANR